MIPEFYSETSYWTKYLRFLPQKYQDKYEVPDESYWNWRQERIHIDSKFSASSEVTAILIHGAGGNGRILSILGSYLSKNDINYYAPDNLGYGLTKVTNSTFEYGEWVDMMCDFTKYIIQKDRKPVVLIGMSIGGMLAYQMASKVKEVAGVIVTTLADPRDEETIIAMSKHKFLATIGMNFLNSFSILTDKVRLPIKWLCKFDLMSRNQEFSEVFKADKYAGRVKVSMKFLRTFVSYKPDLEFDEFDSCPILLLHPEKDDWTPFLLSKKNFDKIKGEKEIHLLKECGHAPIEEPGLSQMESHIVLFIKSKILDLVTKNELRK